MGTFTGPVAVDAAAAELMRDGAVLDRRERSRTADAPGARSAPAPARGDTVVPAAAMEGSRNARVRVSVDDGFGEARAVSQVLRVEGSPPAFTIVRPQRGEPVRANERTVVMGSASDDRRRALSGRALTWYSGRRRLGTGERVSVRLPAGRQVLRLIARDRTGRSATARRTIRVESLPLRIDALPYPPRVGVGSSTVSVRTRTSAAATLRLGGRRHAVGPHLGRIAVRLPARPPSGLLRVPFTLSPTGSGRTIHGALEILRFNEAS